MDRLIAHDWAGNVRDLENAFERALILFRKGPLDFRELSDYSSRGGEQVAGSTSQFVSEESLKLDSVIADHILKVLEITGGKVAGKNSAFRILGVHPATLRHRMRKLGIPFGRRPAIP